ncbi:LMBR1-like membrane protein [Musa troglodytarum]|uniref:LMBR1-like membrane protein n=1 Tax=Musa troglodytarum TaxID=320322 RepID=A0A9E7GZT9_9LILI|nr:LMBR1-like membrane protein [Musa troglodytarum]
MAAMKYRRKLDASTSSKSGRAPGPPFSQPIGFYKLRMSLSFASSTPSINHFLSAAGDDTGFLMIPQSGGADPTVFSKAKAREVVIGRRLVDCSPVRGGDADRSRRSGNKKRIGGTIRAN